MRNLINAQVCNDVVIDCRIANAAGMVKLRGGVFLPAMSLTRRTLGKCYYSSSIGSCAQSKPRPIDTTKPSITGGTSRHWHASLRRPTAFACTT